MDGLQHLTAPASVIVGGESRIRHDVRIGAYSTVGVRCELWGPVDIGRYCQLAANVALYAQNHPISHLTTYVNSNLLEGRMKRHAVVSPIRVGHDVWIGHGAIVLAGVTIGDGSIIGAGAVVTTDVPPFAIAAGNPASVLSYRFDEETRSLVAALEWWNRCPDELAAIAGAFDLDLRESGALEDLARWVSSPS